MSNLITRIGVIILVAGGVWYLVSNSQQNPDLSEKKLAEQLQEKQEQDRNIDDEKRFEIRKETTETENEDSDKPIVSILSQEEKPEPTKKVVTNKKTTTTKTTSKTKMPKIMASRTNIFTQNTQKFIENEPSTTVNVYFYEYKIDISENEIPEGNVTFRAVNNGRLSHNMTLKDQNGNINFGRVAPGETKFFNINLGKSNYEIFSDVTIDEENNMRIELIAQ